MLADVSRCKQQQQQQQQQGHPGTCKQVMAGQQRALLKTPHLCQSS
jgi:hypothetical protein